MWCSYGVQSFIVLLCVCHSMSLTRSKDVPTFGPAIPEGPAFRNSTEFKEFLLTKGTVIPYCYSVPSTNCVELTLSPQVKSSSSLIAFRHHLVWALVSNYRNCDVILSVKLQTAVNFVSTEGCLYYMKLFFCSTFESLHSGTTGVFRNASQEIVT